MVTIITFDMLKGYKSHGNHNVIRPIQIVYYNYNLKRCASIISISKILYPKILLVSKKNLMIQNIIARKILILERDCKYNFKS
jgi:hypothetical protein